MKLRHRAMWWCTWNGSLGLISIFDECDCADRRDARAKICGSRVRMLRMPATEPTAIKNVVGVWNFGRADRDRHVGRAKCMRGTTWAGAGAITEFVFWLSWVSGSAGHADCPGWSIIGHLQLQELTAGYCNRERRRHMQRALSVFINSLITACIHDYICKIMMSSFSMFPTFRFCIFCRPRPAIKLFFNCIYLSVCLSVGCLYTSLFRHNTAVRTLK